MPSIYEQHRYTFSGVSAYVITKDNKKIATVAFKHPKDGGGRAAAYLGIAGVEMTRGYAKGAMIDKTTQAVQQAAKRIPGALIAENRLAAFHKALTQDNHLPWDRNLEAAGFHVHQAV